MITGRRKKRSAKSATARPPPREITRPLAGQSLRFIRYGASGMSRVPHFSPCRPQSARRAGNLSNAHREMAEEPRREETIKHDTSLAGLRGGPGRRDNRRINHSNRRKRAARTNRAAAELSPNSSIVRRLFRAGIRRRERERERERETT